MDQARSPRRRGDRLRGVLAVVALLAQPAALVAVPAVWVLVASLRSGPGGIALTVAAGMAWVALAQLFLCTVVEWRAARRGSGIPPRVPLTFAAHQELARRLVTAALLLRTADQGLRTIPVTGPPAAPRPVPPTARATTDAGGVGADLAASPLLASGVLAAVHRARNAVPPAPAVPPDADAAAVELAARRGADPGAARFLDHALRVFARVLDEHGRPVPEVVAARLSPDRLELVLAGTTQVPPPPFTPERGGARWVLRRDTPLPRVDAAPAPLPGLVTLGSDGVGRILVDLEAPGGPVCVGGDLDAARSFVAAAAVELATCPWAEPARVTLVGFGRALGPLNPHRLRCVDDLADVLPALRDRLEVSGRVLPASGIDSVLTGRVRGLLGGDCTPDLLVLSGPPRPELAAEVADLRAAARALRRAPLGILIAGDVEGARWRLEVDASGTLQAAALGLRVEAQRLSARTYAALTRLVQPGI